MANTKKMQDEATAYVNTAKVMVDKVIGLVDLLNVPTVASLDAMPFILELLKSLGMTRQEMIDFLVKFLTVGLAPFEIAVKAVLLSNVKNMVSCSIDPRIPYKLRKQHKDPSDTQTPNEYGIDVNLEAIDIFKKLDVSPVSDEGQNLYFDVYERNDSVKKYKQNAKNSQTRNIYSFARAYDFDAFLWFVKNKGKFPSPSVIADDFSTFTNTIDGFGASNVEVIGETPLSPSLFFPIRLTFTKDKPSRILVGQTFTQQGNSHIIAMCVEAKRDSDKNIIENIIVPISDDWTSVNWYDPTQAHKSEKGNGANDSAIAYGEGKPLCNLQYIGKGSGTSPMTGLVDSKFKFSILPKPTIHTPTAEEAPWSYIRLLFGGKGFAQNGRLSIFKDTILTDGTVTIKNGKVTVDEKKYKENRYKYMQEAYPGLTVYEFNFDFIMSMKLFDAKVIANSLINSLLSTSINFSLTLNTSQGSEEKEAIKQVIKNLVNNETESITDCHFNFSNEQYDSMLRAAEEKRARKETFGGNVNAAASNYENISELLSQYDTATDLEQQTAVLTQTFQEASVTISPGSKEGDVSPFEYGFYTSLIENLTFAIVESLLTPKVLLLLEVNKQLMGGTFKALTVAELLKQLSGVIMGVINEIKEMLMQQLLGLLLKQLDPIVKMLESILLKEQVEAVAEAMREIAKNCPSMWFKLGNRYSDTQLDQVDYADIEPRSENKNNETPTESC